MPWVTELRNPRFKKRSLGVILACDAGFCRGLQSDSGSPDPMGGGCGAVRLAKKTPPLGYDCRVDGVANGPLRNAF